MKLPFATNLNLSLDTLSERDRKMLLIGGAVAAALLLYIVISLDSSVSSAHKRIAKKTADLAWMQQNGPELAAAAATMPGANGQSLLVIVDRSARESGLGGALAGSEPSGTGALSVRLQRASFDQLVMWLARLSQQNGIRVDSASIENAGGPGIVNAAIVLHMG